MKPFLGAIALACLALGGCGTSSVNLDNPLDGAKVTLGVDQALQVKLSNMTGAGRWVCEGEAPDAVRALAPQVQAAAAGAAQLETFQFVGATPGEDTLTFVYRRPNVQPDVSDVIRIAVRVG